MEFSAVEYIAGVLTRQVVIGKVAVLSVFVSGDAAAGDCQVYDGQGIGDPQRVHIEVESGTSKEWLPFNPVLFRNGLYVVVNAVTTKVTVEYIPLPY